MRFGTLIYSDCVNVPPPPGGDARCADPIFAINNPEICPRQPIFSLKPGTALACSLGTVQFRAFWNINGTEQDVTDQTTWLSSDLDVVMIGARSGNATGLASGVTTVTASYQGQIASAQITVLAGDNCCQAQKVALLVMVDNTKSMSLQFGGSYATRLHAAKAGASRFISEINGNKDVVGLLDFHGTTTDTQAPISADVAGVTSAVSGIPQTQDKTEFFDAVTAGLAQLAGVSAFQRVLVIMSDGEDSLTSSWNASNDPLGPLTDFKNEGGIVICLGLRASGTGFDLLQAMATGGFFINAVPSNVAAAFDFLSGLKGYVCAGNCTPLGDQMVPAGQADYMGFLNWNVSSGNVDLLGNGFFDFLPGHGLYVDLAGSTAPTRGLMVTKNAFNLVAGHTYELQVALAGNQRINDPSFSAQVQLLDSVTGVPVLDHGVLITDFRSPFTFYNFAFTPAYNLAVKIAIQQNPPAVGDDARVGLLLDEVRLYDSTNLTTVFDDDFDDENIVYVPPRCGRGTTYLFSAGHWGYATGYNCYGTGCLDSPPTAQGPDTNPLADIESGPAPPETFTSTKTECAMCPEGSASLGPYFASVLGGGSPPFVTVWHQSAPQLIGTYQVTAASNNTGPQEFDAPRDFTLEGSSDGATWTLLDYQQAQVWRPGELKTYQLATPSTWMHYRLSFISLDPGANAGNNPTMTIQIAVASLFPGSLSQGEQACRTATATSTVSQADADQKASAAALTDARSALTCQQVYTSTKTYTAQCGGGCFGTATATATASSFVSQNDADTLALAAAQAQAQAALDCTQSNNGQQINLPAAGWLQPVSVAGTPFPTVKYVTDTGAITKVTVTLSNLGPAINGDTWTMILRAPDGSNVLLYNRLGTLEANIPNAVTITFDDAGGLIPNGPAVLVSGTYQCKNDGGQNAIVAPAPAPQPPHGLNLASLIGKQRFGCWSLWVSTRATATSQLGSWDLTIT